MTGVQTCALPIYQLVAAGLTDETPVAEDAASKPSRRTKKAQG